MESAVCETEQQSTLTEKLPFRYPSFLPPPRPSTVASHFFLHPLRFLCLLFLLFRTLLLPLLVFLSGLKGMLSGPITQEAGISEIQSGEKGGERNEGGWGGKEAGRRRQLWGGRGGERELRCTKISREVTELKTSNEKRD